MVESSTMCCASSPPERAARAARLWRIPLGALGALALLAGCSDANRDDPEERAPIPPGIELAKVEAVSPEQLETMMQSGKVRLIDVRRDDEVAQGMIAGAEHIALDSFDPEALDLSDGREVVFYCRSGRRSAIAAERLAQAIGRPARHLEGGIKAWQAAGLPLAKPQKS